MEPESGQPPGLDGSDGRAAAVPLGHFFGKGNEEEVLRTLRTLL